MSSKDESNPEWLEEALVMRAEGKSLRGISLELQQAGHTGCTRNQVWMWVTGKGSKRRKMLNTDEHRQANRRYQKAYYKGKKFL